MDSGVTIVDPDNTWIDVRAQIGQDTQIEPFTYIYGAVKIGRNCRIGPFAYLNDSAVVKDGSGIRPCSGTITAGNKTRNKHKRERKG